MRPLVGFLLACCIATVSPVVAAQETTELSSEEGGIRLVGWTVRPSVELEAGYETNVRRLEDSSQADTPDDVVWKASAAVRAHRQGGKARLETSAVWDLRKYLSADNAELDSFADVDLAARAVINPEGNVDFQLSDNFKHETRPLERVNLGLLRRTSNTVQFVSGIHPGGALEASPRAFWTYERFADPDRTLAERNTVALGSQAGWRFYPRTALTAGLEVGRVLYSVKMLCPDQPTPPPAQPLPCTSPDTVTSDSTYLRLLAGVTGKFSEKITGNLRVGFGSAWYDQGPSAGPTLLLESVVQWAPRPRTTLVAGYSRGIVDAYFTNYYVNDRVSVAYKQTLRERFRLSATAMLARQRFSEPYDRDDTVVILEPGFQTRLARRIDMGLNYRYAQRISDSDVASQAQAGPDASQNYQSHSVFLGVTATY